MSVAPAPAAEGALQGRVILVVGAGGGLGSAAAVACARAGATVVLLGRHLRRLERVYDQAAAVGAPPLLYPLDLHGASPDDYAELAQRLQQELGRLDGVLVCAADFAGLTPFELTEPTVLVRTLHVTLTAPALLVQACLPLLRRQPDAAVVFCVDDLDTVGGAYWGGYGLAQHGLRGLLSSLHAELQRGPVRVHGLNPGPMRTALRARAWSLDEDADARGPERAATLAVTLLSPAGADRRGQVVSSAEHDAH